MQDKSYIPFTEEMRRDYTILMPNMLPMHFKLLMSTLSRYGFNFELLESSGPAIAEAGLKYTHNDSCYPAVLVIGQFMDALLSGRYDTHKVALIMFQTGGGCRASNYISLIRKALKKAGMDYIPVISLSFTGLEKHPGFDLSMGQWLRMVFAVLYGDLLMNLVNQCRPYELREGSAEELAAEWIERLGMELGDSRLPSYRAVKANYRAMAASFAALPMERCDKVKVGIVGEIFVKYSPLGNNDLERFLIREGAEPVVPGLLDFALYCIYNFVVDREMYHSRGKMNLVAKAVFRLICAMRRELGRALEESGVFSGLTPFEEVVEGVKDVISHAVKMGEGWLLTAEMLELAESGCSNIVCTQPFGCLPNHICGKGMMRPIKALRPDANIVAIDYDPGASRVNQENRLKLMLANAKKAPSPAAEKETVHA